jgi:hypothetical protein
MMRRTYFTIIALAGWAASAACSGGSSGPPTQDVGNSGSSTGSGSGSSGSGSGSGSGSESEASTGSTSGGADGEAPDGEAPPNDASRIPDAFPDVQTVVPSDAAMAEPTCPVGMTFGTPSQVLGVATFMTASAPLVTMTSDELTVAWVLDAGGGKGNVFITSRSDTSSAFGAAIPVPTKTSSVTTFEGGLPIDGGDPYFAYDRVALSTGGLVIGVSVDLRHFGSVIYLGGNSFEDLTEGPYASLTASLMMATEKLGDPTLAPSALDLVYSHYGANAMLSVYETTRLTLGSNWQPGAGDNGPAIQESNGQRKHPTSLTADRLTLFYWDDMTQEGWYSLRSPASGSFNTGTALGSAYMSPQINADCSRLYYVTPGGGGWQLVSAARN